MLEKMVTSSNLLLVYTGLVLTLLIVLAEGRISLEPPTLEVQDGYPSCSQEAGEMCLYQRLGKVVINGSVNITGYSEDDIAFEQLKLMAQVENDFEYTYYLCAVDFTSCPVADPVTECYCMSKDEAIYHFVMKYSPTVTLSGSRLRGKWVVNDNNVFESDPQNFPLIWRLSTLAPSTTPQQIKTKVPVQKKDKPQPRPQGRHMTTSPEVGNGGQFQPAGPSTNFSLSKGNHSATSRKASTATASEISPSVNPLFPALVLGIVWQACLFYR